MDQISISLTDRVFILTGAGISAESGLPTFRASDGLWAGHRVEDVCTPEALDENPGLVWEFYSKRRADCVKAQPNRGHFALAELEAKLGDRFFLCTQNVDDLHERAGSQRLLHMHGELFRSRCEAGCGRPPLEDRAVLSHPGGCGLLRVWRTAAAAHCVFRRNAAGNEPNRAGNCSFESHVGYRNFRFRLPGGKFCQLGAARRRANGLRGA